MMIPQMQIGAVMAGPIADLAEKVKFLNDFCPGIAGSVSGGSRYRGPSASVKRPRKRLHAALR
jgi:hypothetical protein